MKIILDTCCIIWAVSSPESLSPAAMELLNDETAKVMVSPISAAEIACAVERGRLELNIHWKNWFRHYTELNEWTVEDISLDIIEEAYSLPENFHADPADRIITATARLRNCIVLTADRKILSYPHVNTAW